MNLPPLSSVRIVPPGHTNDGANPCKAPAVPSVPVALPTRVNHRAEPARPLIQHSTARSLPPCRGRMFARTVGDRFPSAAGALQSP
jgi:hypothetical protein